MVGFGAGALSLREIGKLPVDAVAIDPAVVTTAPEGYAVRIVRTIVQAAHSCGLYVVADGAGERQLRWLADTGCDAARGPVASPPGNGLAERESTGHDRGWPAPSAAAGG